LTIRQISHFGGSLPLITAEQIKVKVGKLVLIQRFFSLFFSSFVSIVIIHIILIIIIISVDETILAVCFPRPLPNETILFSRNE